MGQKIKVWDIATRIFHWSLVVCFCTAYITGEGESLLHIYISYIIIGLLAFRLVWGFIGPRYVRFSNFVQGVKPAYQYLQSILTHRPIYYLGHNPLGGWMIVILLVALTLTSWTGLDLYAQQGKGPLASAEDIRMAAERTRDKNATHDSVEQRLDRDNEQGRGKWLEELHEALANLTLLLVLVHIGGVVISGKLHRENLARAMLTGYKTPPDDFKAD